VILDLAAQIVARASAVMTARRRLSGAAFFLAAALLCSGCMTAFVPEHQEAPPAPAALVIEVSGTPGLGFEGSFGTAPATKAVEGQVPARYAVETAVALAVNLRKAAEDGELTVRVLRGDREVARQSTTAPYGSVLLVYRVTP
jgi:hypothetical protein